jgi:hypothetical protein
MNEPVTTILPPNPDIPVVPRGVEIGHRDMIQASKLEAENLRDELADDAPSSRCFAARSSPFLRQKIRSTTGSGDRAIPLTDIAPAGRLVEIGFAGLRPALVISDAEHASRRPAA